MTRIIYSYKFSVVANTRSKNKTIILCSYLFFYSVSSFVYDTFLVTSVRSMRCYTVCSEWYNTTTRLTRQSNPTFNLLCSFPLQNVDTRNYYPCWWNSVCPKYRLVTRHTNWRLTRSLSRDMLEITVKSRGPEWIVLKLT